MSDLDKLDEMYDEARSLVNKQRDVPLLSLKQMENQYGVPGCLSTGHPSWDLHLVGKHGQYGFPYGTICEIYGQEGARKSSELYNLACKNVAYGGKHLGEEDAGVSTLLMAETDWSEEYIASFGRRYGLDAERLDELKFGANPVKTLSEANDFVAEFLKPYEKYADKLIEEGKNPHDHLPRILIGLDSMGKIQSVKNKETLDDDFEKDKKIGSKATAIHDFFQQHWLTFSKLGVLFIYTNHYRDNIGFGNKKHNPAHNSALKYYASVRCEFKRGYDRNMSKKKKSDHREYREGWPFVCRVRKKRDKETFASEVEINYWNNQGLDYFQSLTDGAQYAGIIKKYSNLYKLKNEDCKFAEEYGDEFPIKKKEFRSRMKDSLRDPEDGDNFVALLDREIYRQGPEEVVEKVVRRED